MDSTRRHSHTDYYAVLGVRKNASQQEIKQAYHELARRYHPDTNAGNTEAASRFKEINEAYSMLADPEKRQEYDERSRQRETTRPQSAYQRSRAPYANQPGTASGRFKRFSTVPSRQNARPPGVAANLDLSVAGLSLGLRIVDNLIARLDRAVSSSDRTTPPRRPPPGSPPGTDRRR